jgi:hypothetical protein
VGGVPVVALGGGDCSAQQQGPDPLHARLTGQTWCMSFVTLGELTKWTVVRS